MQKFLFAAFAVTLVSGAACAQAAPVLGAQDDATAQVRVDYTDLDTGTEAGRKTLERRVRYATDAVCGGSLSRDLSVQMAQRLCRRNAMKGADVQLARVLDGNRVVVAAANTKVASR